MKPLNSAITTLQEELGSATGMPRGERGLATPEDLPLVARWLAKHQPADVDRAAVSRASSHGVGLELDVTYRFPKDEKGNSLPMVTVIRGCAVWGDDHAIPAALDDLRKFQTPASARDIEEWLAELSVIVARRQDDEFTESLRLEAYAARLRRYPADVSREAVLGRTWKFWPSWQELEEVCLALAAPRSAMIRALAHRSTPKAPTDSRGDRVSAERAAQIIREVFGEKPQ